MKKLLLCLLILIGGVSGAGATKLYVCLDRETLWWLDDGAKTFIYAYENANSANNLDVEMTRNNMYGDVWFTYELPSGIDRVYIKRVDPLNTTTTWNQAALLEITGDTYVKIKNDGDQYQKTTQEVSAPSWHYIVMRGTVVTPGALWTNDANNTTKNGDVFTYEVSKSQIDAMTDDVLAAGKIRFRFHHGDPVIFDDYGTNKNNGYGVYPEIAPQTEGGKAVSVATDISDYCQYVNSSSYWEIDKPSYDYDKIVFTADYSTHSWVIRADVYFSKTVSGTNEYATFGTTVPVDLSAISDVIAYTLSADASTGKITKTAKSDALAANEGVLLHNATGEDITLSIPVAASAEASSKNDLKAFTGDGKLTKVTETDYTNYILTKEDAGVGFYKVNSEGNNMGTNTAYLHVKNDAGGARSFYFFEEEATGIHTTKANQTEGIAYNMNGQRVAQPTKGLYIVNGKKIVRK